jgi:hypothetical protein
MHLGPRLYRRFSTPSENKPFISGTTGAILVLVIAARIFTTEEERLSLRDKVLELVGYNKK